MRFEFNGEIWYWRGPAPWHFVTVPPEACRDIEAAASRVTYGWGMIPVTATIGSTAWTTSLWPKDGSYILPIRTDVRRAEKAELGDLVTVRLVVEPRH